MNSILCTTVSIRFISATVALLLLLLLPVNPSVAFSLAPNGKYRPVGGAGTNSLRPDEGTPLKPYLNAPITGNRSATQIPEFRDGVGAVYPTSFNISFSANTTNSTVLPNARVLSNFLFAFGANETAPGEAPSAEDPQNTRRRVSELLNFIAHVITPDIGRTATSASEAVLSIPIPPCDPLFDPLCTGNPVPSAYNLTRTVAVFNASDTPGIRRPINGVSPYLDLSPIYTDSVDTLNLLRRFTGGLLKSHVANVTFFVDGEPVVKEVEFLPLAKEVGGVFMQFHPARAGLTDPGETFALGSQGFNGSPPTLAVLTLFHRNHNRYARAIAQAHPELSDEVIFQEARRRNIADYQKIVFYEYLPVLLGSNGLKQYQGFDPSVVVGADCFFSAVSFRYGHSEFSDNIVVSPPPSIPQPSITIPFNKLIFRPLNLFTTYDISSLLLGQATTIQRDVDIYASAVIRSAVWDLPTRGGIDLVAIGIERAREHGCWNYANARQRFGLPVPASFNEISPEDPALAERIRLAYDGKMELVDAHAAGLAEAHVDGGNLGALFYASIVEQFERLRDGDPFYFEAKEARFDQEELQGLRKTGIRDLLLANSFGLESGDVPLNLWQVALPSSNTGLSTNLSSLYPNSLQLTQDYAFYWRIDGQTLYVAQHLSGTTGWAGIAFAKGLGQSMPGADFIIGASDGQGGWVVKEYGSSPKGFDRPIERTDKTITVTLANVSSDGSSLVFEWHRPLSPSVPDRQPIQPGLTQLIFAYDTAQSDLSFHGANRGLVAVDLFATQSAASVTPATNMDFFNRVVHGIGMILTFCLVFPSAIYIARYARHTDYWVTLHVTLQGIAGISFVALGTAAAATVLQVGGVSNHAKIGIATFAVVVLQLCLGVGARLGLAHRFPGYRKIRTFHHYLGLCILLIGNVNVHFGLQLQWPLTWWIGSIVLGCWQILVASVFFLTELGYRGIIYFPMPDESVGPVIVKAKDWADRTLLGKEVVIVSPELVQVAKKTDAIAEPEIVHAYSWDAINRRVAEGDEWIVIDGCVYDVGDWKAAHPGGKEVLKRAIGLDVTLDFCGGQLPASAANVAGDEGVRKGGPSLDLDSTLAQTRRRSWSNQKKGSDPNIVRTPRSSISGAGSPTESTSPAILLQQQQQPGELPIEVHSHTFFAVTKLRSLLVGRLERQPEDLKDEFGRYVLKAKSTVSPTHTVSRADAARTELAQDGHGAPDRDPRPSRRFSFEPLISRQGDPVEFLPGQSIELRARIRRKMVVRSYSPLSGNLLDGFQISVKIYPRGIFTTFLDLNSVVGKFTVEVRGPVGTPLLCQDRLDKCWDRLLMLAGGAGVTPCIQMIKWHLYRCTARVEGEGCLPPTMRLVYVNHSESEAMEMELLKELEKNSEGRFSLQLVFGRLKRDGLEEAVEEFLEAEDEGCSGEQSVKKLAIVSGPEGFVSSSRDLLHELGVADALMKLL